MATQPIHLDYQQIITDDRESLIEDSFRLWGSELILFSAEFNPHTLLFFAWAFSVTYSV